MTGTVPNIDEIRENFQALAQDIVRMQQIGKITIAESGFRRLTRVMSYFLSNFAIDDLSEDEKMGLASGEMIYAPAVELALQLHRQEIEAVKSHSKVFRVPEISTTFPERIVAKRHVEMEPFSKMIRPVKMNATGR